MRLLKEDSIRGVEKLLRDDRNAWSGSEATSRRGSRGREGRGRRRGRRDQSTSRHVAGHHIVVGRRGIRFSRAPDDRVGKF